MWHDYDPIQCNYDCIAFDDEMRQVFAIFSFFDIGYRILEDVIDLIVINSHMVLTECR